MVPSLFIGQNIHFAIGLFAALACFAAGWLYLDAWHERRRLPVLLKWLGFFVLAAGFLAQSAVWGTPGVLDLVATILKLIAYGVLVAGDVMEPLQPRPKTSSSLAAGSGLTVLAQPASWVSLVLPLAAFTVGFMYWRRATTGLERHLKPLAYTFGLLALAEVLGTAELWRATDNPLLQPIVAAAGPLWIAEHLAMVLGAAMLASWIWRYLTKRLLSQIFIMSTCMTVSVVLLTTMTITTLLYGSLQRDALANLETAGRVLNYAIASKTAETRSNAEILSENSALGSAAAVGNRGPLVAAVSSALTTKQLSEVIITSDDGQVLARASDPDRYGDSLSEDSLVRRALTGKTSSSIVTSNGVMAPDILITTVSPIRHQGGIVGTVTASLALDNSFVDGIKGTTGLDSAVFSGKTRTATTMTGPDGTSRAIGAKEASPEVATATLSKGQSWKGQIDVLNQPFLVAYLPLKDIDNEVVGMLFVGQHREVLFSVAEQSIRLTFIAAAGWLLLMIVPLYAVCRKIAGQLQ